VDYDTKDITVLVTMPAPLFCLMRLDVTWASWFLGHHEKLVVIVRWIFFFSPATEVPHCRYFSVSAACSDFLVLVSTDVGMSFGKVFPCAVDEVSSPKRAPKNANCPEATFFACSCPYFSCAFYLGNLEIAGTSVWLIHDGRHSGPHSVPMCTVRLTTPCEMFRTPPCTCTWIVARENSRGYLYLFIKHVSFFFLSGWEGCRWRLTLPGKNVVDNNFFGRWVHACLLKHLEPDRLTRPYYYSPLFSLFSNSSLLTMIIFYSSSSSNKDTHKNIQHLLLMK
jgi:hypothetical protein